MTSDSEVIHVDPGSELDSILKEAGNRSVILERGGIRYRLNRETLTIADEDDPLAGYDPDRALAGMRAAAGGWGDVDAEAMKELIFRAREEARDLPSCLELPRRP